mgnify:FL=1
MKTEISLNIRRTFDQICSSVEFTDNATIFSIPNTNHLTWLHTELVSKMIKSLGFRILAITEAQNFDSDNPHNLSSNYVIETNLPMQKYHELIN